MTGSIRRERRRLQAQRTALDYMIERRPQSTVVIVLDRHKTERLQDAIIELPHRAQDFCHPVHGPGLGLERDFHEVSRAEGLRQAQQTSSYRNGLEFSFRTAAIFKTNRS